MVASRPPRSDVEVSFETVREGWSIYKTKESKGSATIKLKVVVLKLFLEQLDEGGNAQFGAASRLVLTVTVPRNMKGPPSKTPITPKAVADSIVEVDVPFEVIREDWNEYRIDGAVVSIKPIATIISKTSLFDSNGDPVYNVQNQPIVKGVVPPESRKRLLKILREKSTRQT
jgi:hypothetical protein